MQYIRLLTTQSVKRGKSGRQNMKRSLSYLLFVCIMFIKTYLHVRYQLEKNLLLNKSLTIPWTNKLWE